MAEPPSPDVAAILHLEQRLASAWVAGDRAFIEALLAPDWAVTDAAGRVLSRSQVIEETFVGSERRIETMTIDDVAVRVFGQAAVATGRTRASGSYQDIAVSVVLRFTDVFVRREGRWQIVASHGSMVTT